MVDAVVKKLSRLQQQLRKKKLKKRKWEKSREIVLRKMKK